jgi:hypothetical protein
MDLLDKEGNERGFVEPKFVNGRPVLEDLWVGKARFAISVASTATPLHRHPTTACSKSPAPKYVHLEAAERFGVQKIYFTGGEVFVNEDVLQVRRNGTKSSFPVFGWRWK